MIIFCSIYFLEGFITFRDFDKLFLIGIFFCLLMFVGSVYAADDGCNVLLNDSADDVNLLEMGDDCQNDSVEIDENNDDSVVGDCQKVNDKLSLSYEDKDNLSLADEDVLAASTSTKIVVSSTSVVYGDSLTARLLTSANKAVSGKTLKITINGKSYSKTTNSKGYVYLPLKLAAKSYSTSIVFSGASGYTKSSKTVTIKVTKRSTNIVVDNVDMVYGDGSNLTAYLYDNKNTALSGKTISLTVGSVSYGSGTKDSNGKATIKINMDPGKYKPTIKFNGDNYYSASTKSCNVKILGNYSKAISFGLDDIETSACEVKKYIENHHNLPDNVVILGYNVSKEQYLDLFANSLSNLIDGDNSSKVFLGNYSSVVSSENVGEINLTKSQYTTLINSILSQTGKSVAPGYINFNGKNIATESLIYLCCQLLDSYQLFNNLPDKILLLPWSVISNNNTNLVTMEEVFKTSENLVEYIETKHSLPASIYINTTSNELISINWAQFLKLELDTFMNFNSNCFVSLVVKNYNNAADSSETITGGTLNNTAYNSAAVNVLNFMNINGRAPNYVTTVRGSISFESLIYTYAEILVSINRYYAAPDEINLVPWSMVKNNANIFISMDNVSYLAGLVKKNIRENHNLPSSLSCDGRVFSIPQFLNLELGTIKNINSNLFQSLLLKSYSGAASPSESLTRGKFSKDYYLNMVDNIKSFLVNNNRAPNYVTTSYGQMRYENYITMFAEVIEYAGKYNKLPAYAMFNQWSVVSSSNCVIFNDSDVLGASHSFISYVESNHTIPSIIKVGSENLNKNQFLYLLVTLIHKINGTYSGDLILDSYSSASVSETLTSGILDKNSYLDIARLIGYDMSYNDHVDETTSLGKISTNSALYIFSQILSSYDYTNVLPDFVNVKPWNIISNTNTKFYSLSDIINSSTNLKDYIDNNSALPGNICICGDSVSMPNVLKLFATCVVMIGGNLNANIAFENYATAGSACENITGDNLDYNDYMGMALNLIVTMDSTKKVPDYLSSDFGKVRYESLIHLYSNVLSYFKLNNALLDNTVLLPWSKINSKIFTIDEISQSGVILKDYIEKNHSLPSNVVVGGVSLNLIQYLQVASETILNLNSNMYSSISYRDYSSSVLSSENLDESFDIHLLEYVSLIEDLNSYIDENHKTPAYLVYEINYNEVHLGFNSLTYLISEVLTSYNKCGVLPEFLTYVPWSIIGDGSSVFLTHEDIVNSTYLLNGYVNVNHALPVNVVVGGVVVNCVQLMDLYSTCIYNINFNIYQSVLLDNLSDIYSCYENIVCGDLEFYEYISLVYSMKEYLDDNVVVSNLSDLSLGDNIGFNTLLLMESCILGNYSSLNVKGNSSKVSIASFSNDDSFYGLPEEVSVIPWVVVSNPGKVYNYRNGKVFDFIQDAIGDNDTLSHDYIGIAKRDNFENIVVDKSIYLSCVDGYTVNICGDGTLMTVLADNVTVDSLNFVGGSVGVDVNASSCKLSDCVFNSTGTGVILGGFDNYIGFSQFDNVDVGVCVGGSRNTVESNKIKYCGDYGVFIKDACDIAVIGNIILGDCYSVYVNGSRVDINFNSLVSDNGVFVNSVAFVNLSDNWWGCNNPGFSNCVLLGNVSCNSWLVLSLKYFADWSSLCNASRNVNVIADLKCNNLGRDLSRDYTLDDVNVSFSSDFGDIEGYALTSDGYANVVLNASSFGVAQVNAFLDGQVVSVMVEVPSNSSCGVYNNRSGRYYYCIQDAIDDNDTLSGDVIVLKSGFYSENIFIYKDITIFGDGVVYLNPLVDSKATVTIFGSNISVCNLCIGGEDESYAVSALGVNISFANCNFTDAMVGLYLMGCVNISVCDCNFLDNEYGSYSSYTRNLLFNGSRFVEDSYGVYALSDSGLRVVDCVFDDSWIGVDLSYCNSTLLDCCNFSGSYLGLELVNSNLTSISGNLFAGNIVGYSLFNSSVFVSLNVFNGNVLGDFGSFDDPGVVLQRDMWSCGPASLTTILNRLGYSNFNQEMVINGTNINSNGTSLFGLYKFLKDNGFSDVAALRVNSSDICVFDLVLLNISGDYHFSVVWNLSGDWVVLADSTAGLLNISRDSFNRLFSGIVLIVNGSGRVGLVVSNQEMAKIYGTSIVDVAWSWMNTPCYTVPGYANLDKDYGLLGTGVKILGDLFLGIDDNGSIRPIDIALDILSVFSGVGLAERVGVSLTTKAIQIGSKYSKFNKLMSYGEKIEKSNLFEKGTLVFDKYNSILGFISNPKGAFAEKIIEKILSPIESSKVGTFVSKYLDNNFRTFASVTGLDGSYDDAKNNIADMITKVKFIKGAVVKNTHSMYNAANSLIKSASKIASKTVTHVHKKIMSDYTHLKKKVYSIGKFAQKKFKSSCKYVKNKFYSGYNKLNKKVNHYYKKANHYYKKSIKVYNKTKKKIYNYGKNSFKYLKSYVKKFKFW